MFLGNQTINQFASHQQIGFFGHKQAWMKCIPERISSLSDFSNPFYKSIFDLLEDECVKQELSIQKWKYTKDNAFQNAIRRERKTWHQFLKELLRIFTEDGVDFQTKQSSSTEQDLKQKKIIAIQRETQVDTLRPYVPKYNTFTQSENYDLHVEIGDERFDLHDARNKSLNILRSKSLREQFHFTLDDIEAFFSSFQMIRTHLLPYLSKRTKEKLNIFDDMKINEEKSVENSDRTKFILGKINNMNSLYSYSHLGYWNNEQKLDTLNQIWGEKESLLLDDDALWREIRFHLKNKKYSINFTSHLIYNSFNFDTFQQSYLTYLRSLDVAIHCSIEDLPCTQEEFVFEFCPSTITLNSEYIDYLTSYYFIPWKKYSRFDQISKVIFPMSRIEIKNKELIIGIRYSDFWEEMKKRRNRIFGGSMYKNLVLSKEQQNHFYGREKKTFLEGKRISDGEKLLQLIRRYEHEQNIRDKITQFCDLWKRFSSK